MKNNYKINEISNLINIGKDSTRYCEEIGILKPERDSSGYRLYSMRDIWKLNVIKDLSYDKTICKFTVKSIANHLLKERKLI